MHPGAARPLPCSLDAEGAVRQRHHRGPVWLRAPNTDRTSKHIPAPWHLKMRVLPQWV
jgi:hypothetical protein